jgi:hypothetical protein
MPGQVPRGERKTSCLTNKRSHRADRRNLLSSANLDKSKGQNRSGSFPHQWLAGSLADR